MEKYCQNCRQSNSAEAQFCRFCASPLPAASAQSGGQTAQQQQGNYTNRSGNAGFVQNQAQNQFAANNAAPAAGASGRAIGSVALTAFGFLLCCVLTSVPGAILGWMEMTAIKEGRSSPRGMTMAQIGFYGGMAMTVLNLLFYGIYLLMVVSAGMNGGANY